jgi:hypothetical protein
VQCLVPVAQGISDTFLRKGTYLATARKKLNQANVTGAMVVGTLAGLALNSWIAFVVVTVLLLAAAVYQRDIR